MDLIRANAIERLVVIAMMDLNGLKAVNDRHGHKMADWLLVSFANNLPLSRQQDKAYRYGGMKEVLQLGDERMYSKKRRRQAVIFNTVKADAALTSTPEFMARRK